MAKRRPSNKSDDAPHIREFIGAAVSEFGGVKGFAKKYVEVFNACKKGSAAQGSMMANLSNLIFRHTDRFGVKKDMDSMTDAELAAVIRRALSEDEAVTDTTIQMDIEANEEDDDDSDGQPAGEAD